MSPVLASVLADLVLLAHFAFVAFVVAGGLLVLRWPRLAWAHVPAAVWGALIEFGGWICPLTPVENTLRAAAGERPYTGDFIAHYLMPVLYPEGLTREIQLALGGVVMLVNAAIYGMVIRRRGSARDLTGA